MAYQALYRKWRPATFDDVVGQSHVVATLKNEIISGKTAHAYLFCGTRGTGKTTCAKIFARAINCTNPKNGNPCNECEICKGVADGSILDVTEIDAASNNGVDNIREIRDEVAYSAAHAKYKIYIIDEVHMLSTGAFNALLKTLEEPPPHVVFILATTEAHKLPATITSRCQRFDFRRISVKDMVIRLKEITTAEGITAGSEALELIARLADGALRDALSILDQCVSASGDTLTVDSAMAILGVASDQVLDDIVTAVANREAAAALASITALLSGGGDLPNFMESLIMRFRDIMVCAVSKSSDNLFEYSAHTIDAIKKQSAMFAAEEMAYILKVLCDATVEAKWSKNARTIYEIAVMRICDNRLSVSADALAARVANLEQQLARGVQTAQSAQNAPAPMYQPPAESAEPAPMAQPTELYDGAPSDDDAPPDTDLPWVEEEPFSEPVSNPVAETAPIIEPKPVVMPVVIEETPVAEPAIEPKIDTTPVVEPNIETKPDVEAKPAAPQVGVANTANLADVKAWNEVLVLLKKSSIALYGALSVKKAKLTEAKLYLPNEAYLKAILSALNQPLADAIKTVTGRDINVSFVSDAELDEIKDGAIAAAPTRAVAVPIVVAPPIAEAPQEIQQVSPIDIGTQEPPIQEEPYAEFETYSAESLAVEEPFDTPDSIDSAETADAAEPVDPMDALFDIEGLSIEIE